MCLSSSEKKRHGELLQRARSRPALTVGENEGFLDDGGIIEFVRMEDTIRFALNLTAARAASLKVSANLLKVAEKVRGRRE